MEIAAPSRKSTSQSVGVWMLMVASFLTVLAVLAIPMYVIRPFRPQGADALALALSVRNAAPWISGFCALLALFLVVRMWTSNRWLARITLGVLAVLTVVGAGLTHVNLFEVMFHPYDAPSFESAETARVDSDDKVLAVNIGAQSHAYPIRTMGYHHIVNDTVGDVPIAATYCTLCHTGLVWNRRLDGRTLHFRLAGINNGNALMRDEETSSIWQQSTGEAIFGPLKGQQLAIVHSNELSFKLWRTEQPKGRVLKPDTPYVAEYETKDWERHIETTRTVVDTRQSGVPPHELMLGVSSNGSSKAYPIKLILAEKLIQDQIDALPVMILVGPDETSIRVFRTQSAGDHASLTFLRSAGNADGAIMQDAETGSLWNFTGCAIKGQRSGQCLVEMDANKDYWFDWMNHHPSSTIFKD